ncbi:MAG TPA: hypothetical protein VLV86_20585 [Vicinamibacterales bacterium]|nr:hypothetical protein [Vicinamibacterales bacterium]
MKKRVVLAMALATAVASVVNLGLFYLVTAYLVEPYLRAVGPLVHQTVDQNRALLNLVTQGAILGGLGGSLYVFQLITTYIASGGRALMKDHNVQDYFLYAMVVPHKGLVAGVIGATIVGGIVMLVSGYRGLDNGHLFIIGCACVAGYSEQFLQRLVDLTTKRVEKIAEPQL